MTEERVIDFDELEALVLTCQSCKSRLILPLAETYRPMGASFVPQSCGVCGARHDTALDLFDQFRRAAQNLAKLRGRVQLQLRSEPTE